MKPFSFPLLVIFFTLSPSNSQTDFVSSPSFVFKVIKGVYMYGTDNFFLYYKSDSAYDIGTIFRNTYFCTQNKSNKGHEINNFSCLKINRGEN